MFGDFSECYFCGCGSGFFAKVSFGWIFLFISILVEYRLEVEILNIIFRVMLGGFG